MLEIYVSMKYVCVNKVVAYITFNSAFLIHGTLKFYLPENIFFSSIETYKSFNLSQIVSRNASQNLFLPQFFA